ncbi:hypothetical protein [Hyalangium sp.]|uniref:hypothetical protein n=1 Tax=Hyalangium sp. TaxID=2028555 RepID=UPI002D38EB66|nr:hypothetical protein [Hyalangium sp.]HYH94864.1 hypothetical protein [Hyalangium sp.]
MKYLTTDICLPPGSISSEVVRMFFWKVFEEYRWFRPMRYGRAVLNGKLDPARIDYGALVAHYEEHRNITVTARTDRDFFLLYSAKSEAYPYIGAVIWGTSAKEGTLPTWRHAHRLQVMEIMQLLGSPLAIAALDEDRARKKEWLVPNDDGLGSTLVPTVRDYSEGLAGLFWRNFYGPLFIRTLGERLATLPGEVRQDVGSGIVLVQPYELPTQAGTPEGMARERQLIAQLGAECFYDHERHLKPTRVPDLPAPG